MQTDVTHTSIFTEPINQSVGANLVIENLDLTNFKSKPCSMSQQHNHKHCPFFHNMKDRKRPTNIYSSDMCEYVDKNEVCPYGDNCTKSHNRVEQLY